MKLKLLLGSLMFAAITANAQVATIDENFESAVVSSPANYNNLVNGWTKKVNATAPHNIYIDGTSDNKYVNFYAAGSTAADVFLISPQITAPDGTKQLIFSATPQGGSTLEIGLVDNPADLNANSGVPASYQLIQSYTLTTTPLNVAPITIPASSKQYIVFRFRNPQLMGAPGSGVSHAVLSIDNVKYNSPSFLAVADSFKNTKDVLFAINSENTALQFVAKKDPKNIEIYSAGAQKVAGGKLSGRSFDISALQTGVYYIIIETAEGSVVKSKFIKK